MNTGSTSIRPAIAYTRVSTADQGRRGNGLDAQREAIERFAAVEGYQVVQWVTESRRARVVTSWTAGPSWRRL